MLLLLGSDGSSVLILLAFAWSNACSALMKFANGVIRGRYCTFDTPHNRCWLNFFDLEQGVTYKDVSKALRSRFGTSGVEEKASRPSK